MIQKIAIRTLTRIIDVLIEQIDNLRYECKSAEDQLLLVEAVRHLRNGKQALVDILERP